jgi:hypothetical protein
MRSRCSPATNLVRKASSFLVLVSALHFAGTPAVASPAGETSICRATGAQTSPAAVSDGAGGMFVTWLDARRGLSDLYAQHMRADGIVDPVWTQDGNAVTQSGTAGAPAIFSDGQGGALIVWFDNSASAVCAQRMLGDGSHSAGWPANGRQLATPVIGTFAVRGSVNGWSADSVGNLYVCWSTVDYLYSFGELWLQRFDVNGEAAWSSPTPAGSTGAYFHSFGTVQLAASSQGATIVYNDLLDYFDDGCPCYLFHETYGYAVRINPDGARSYATDVAAPYGTPRVLTSLRGVAVNPAGATFVSQNVPGMGNRVLKLDVTGAIVWPNDRSTSGAGPLLADDVGGVFVLGGPGLAIDRRAEDGTVPAGWTGSGLQIAPNAPSGNVASAIVPGGILLCWTDDAHGGGSDVRAIGITNDGAIAAGWKAGGTRISTAHGAQASPALVATSDGRGLAAWVATRPRDGGDIYGNLVAPSGALSQVRDATVTASATEAETDRPAALSLRVEAGASGTGRVRFALQADGDASLDLVDVVGRRVCHRIVSGARSVSQTITFPTADLPSGVYWACLRQGREQVSAKLLLIR